MSPAATPTDAAAITSEWTIEEIVNRFPAVVPVFIARRMHCVGCAVARFERVIDACRIYQHPLDGFLAELRQTGEHSDATDTSS